MKDAYSFKINVANAASTSAYTADYTKIISSEIDS